MKKVFVIFILINITTLLFSEPDFRKVNWGDSREHIRNTETAVHVSLQDSTLFPDALIYDVTIAFSEAKLFYLFAYNKLVGSSYSFTKNHLNHTNKYITDFYSINDLLRKIYGEPFEDKIGWKDGTKEENKNDLGSSLVTGNLIYITSWKTEETWIVHSLQAEDIISVEHEIDYISLKLRDLAQQSAIEGL